MPATAHTGPRPDTSTTNQAVSLPASLDDLDLVAIATDENDEALAGVRGVVLELARNHGFDVLLYDRSNERWTDHPHPIGPLSADEVDAEERGHLVQQLRAFEDAGVRVTAWLATVPALTAMLDMFQSLEVDAVVLPEQLDEPKMMDRLQVGKTAPMMVQRIAELSLQHPPIVLSVSERGDVTVAEFDA